MTNRDEQTAAHMQIGELAKATGLTVRTLHHYDAIGLLVPAERLYTGRRLYSDGDVRRLYRIVALRRLGLALDQIGTVLDREPDLVQAVRGHLAEVEEGIEAQRRLQRTLTRMLERLERQCEPTLDQFIEAIEEMTMRETYYTPEQQEQLARRRDGLGEQGMRKAERDWAELIEAVRAEQAAGTRPDDPRMLELARRWQALIGQFTGGDEGILRSLKTMYREEGPKAASRGMVDPALLDYVGRSVAALGESLGA